MSYTKESGMLQLQTSLTSFACSRTSNQFTIIYALIIGVKDNRGRWTGEGTQQKFEVLITLK